MNTALTSRAIHRVFSCTHLGFSGGQIVVPRRQVHLRLRRDRKGVCVLVLLTCSNCTLALLSVLKRPPTAESTVSSVLRRHNGAV